jgi:hypothetical protein
MLFQECLNNWIRACGTQGSGIKQFLWPSTVDAHALCSYEGYSPHYFIFVADAGNNRIVKLRWDYETDEMIWLGTITGGGIDWPQDLDINNGGTFRWNSDDYLWVLNGQQIKRFTMDGVLRKTYGSYGCNGGIGQFCRPTAVVCGRSLWLPPPYDEFANVSWFYVADDGNHRIVMLNKVEDSEDITWIKSVSLPLNARISDLETDNIGHVWAVDEDNGRIYKYDMGLYPLCYFGSSGTGENQFYRPVSFSNTGGYLGCGDVFVAEAWTDSSGGQYFAIGTDVLDFEVTSSVDYQWHYINYTLVDPSVVTIEIYNQYDQLVKTLFNDVEYSGVCSHVWDGTTQSGQQAPPGDYKIVLIDSSMYENIETRTPVNIVTKEDWTYHQGYLGEAPSNLVAYQTGVDKVTLQWEYPEYFSYRFLIYCDGCLSGVTAPHARTYTDSGLVSGRSYIYWVKVDLAPRESPPSNADTVTLSSFDSFISPEEVPIPYNHLASFGIPYQPESCDVGIEYTTAYPGHFAEIPVHFKNPEPIYGFNFLIKIQKTQESGPSVMDFHTTQISQDSILISSNWVDYPVRECFIDTTGSLINNFNSLFVRGQVADTTLPECNYLWVKGWAQPDSFIPPSPNYRLLFRFGVDLSCICDADTIRDALFDIPFGYFVDEFGYPVPFRYHPGELYAWWSRPGDANNDSLVNSADMAFLVNYLFGGGPSPCIPEAGDLNADCDITSADYVYIINYLFGGGPPPQQGCYCPQKK